MCDQKYPKFATEWHNFLNCRLEKLVKIIIYKCVKSIFVDLNCFLYLCTTQGMAILFCMIIIGY